MIIKGSNYGDPREQAARETPHGLTPNTIEQLRDRFEQFLPGMSDTHGAASRQFFAGLLPEGAELSPMQKQANCPTGVTFPGFRGGGGGTMITPQRPYQPEFETCFEDTVVLMANGEYKQLKDIKVGDKVIDKNGLVQKVTHKRSMGVPDEMIEIKTWGGAIVYATDWHKWPVWAWPRTCACGCGEEVNIGRLFKLNHYKKDLIDFKIVDGGKESYRQRRIPINYEPFQKLRSDELKKGDFLVIPRKFKELNPGISLLQARLLGYYLSEGSVSKDYLELTFGMHEIDTWVNDSSSILDTLDIINHLETNEKHNVARVRTKFGDKKDNLVKLSRWLIKNGGKSCYHKRMSGEVLRWPLKYKIEVLKGMFRGDGSQVYASSYKDGYLGEQFQVTYYTSSQDLARHTNLILAQLGIFSRIQYIKPGTGKSKNGKKFKRNEGWRVITSNKSARKLSDLVWNTDTKYKSRKWKVRENCMLDDDYVYVPISSIKLVKNKDKKSVINITVSGDKSYLVNNNIGTYNSPDRQQYPVHRILANRYWRLFFKLDPVIGNCLDMYSTMPWSDFQLSGEGVTGEIKEAFETMCRETQVLRILEYMVKEFMVIGECVPHCFFDDVKGIWTYIALHNPDQLEVIDAPFIKMEPIVEFIPDDRLRAVLTSSNHLLRQVREQMPPELISRLIARQNIPLSPINMTFIPRRMHPYDTRGTSIISRMWRILMYEDGIYNASIATARRHAGPLKVAKLGNPQTGWIPSQEHEKRLLQLLAQAELDVNAWLVYHYGIQFEMVGTTDRIMNISQHHEVIERIKLIAMGISKSFLHGEVTYACLREGTPILTNNYTYKNIEDIEEDDRVIDKNGKIQTIKKAWCEGVPEELYEVKLWGNKTIVSTENHKWPVWAWPRNCACGCGEKVKPGKCFVQHHHERTGGRYNQIELKYIDGETAIGGKPRQIPKNYNPIQKLRSDELCVGDYLMIPRKFDSINPTVSKNQARLLGYYISEGCKISNKGKINGVRWTFNINELNTYCADVIRICNELNINAKVASYENKQTSVVSAFGNVSRSLFKWFKKNGGEYSCNKHLSKSVMRWPVSYKLELIKGMYFGDGSQYFHNTKDKHGNPYKQFMVVYTTVSETLANQLQIILAQLGFYAIIDIEKERIGKDGSKRNKLYLIKTYGNHARNLSKLIWRDKSEADISKNNIRDRFKVDDDYIYVPIKSITKIKNTKPVYNLSVTESHSYIANGFGTYNSSITGLSVFLQRMKSVRNFFVNTWLIPKFFLPIARINGWIRRDKKEINFRYRVKRSQRELELENRWIVPKLEWEKRLDHNIDGELVAAMNTLEQMGIRFSKTTKYAAVGRKFEEELGKIKEEQQYERELNEYIPPEQLAGGPGAPGGAPGGLPPMPGGGPKPTGAPGGAPPSGLPTPGGGGATPNAPVGGGAAADKEGEGGGTGPSGKRDPATRETESVLWDHKGRYGNWSASEVTELCNLIREGYTNSPLWEDMDGPEFRRAVNSGDPWQLLEIIEEHLEAEGYPSSDARQLRKILDSEGVLKDIANGEIVRLKEIEASLGDGIGSINDKQAMDRLANMLDGQEPEVIRTSDPKSLMIGNGNEDRVWSGDISGILGD